MKSTKQGFAVVNNSDLTEGKGYDNYLYICDNLITAKRLATGRGVCGSPAIVKEVELFTYKDMLYGPVSIEYATKSDKKRLSKQVELDTFCSTLLDKGISAKEIEKLRLCVAKVEVLK